MGYASDLRDAEWALLEPWLEPKPKGRPRQHELRDICNALRYVQRTGCQWRMLPVDFPPWRAVYQSFWRWRHAGVWEHVMHQLGRAVRVKAGRKPEPTLAIIDSQSVKTAQKGGSGASTRANKSRGASATSR
jgi:putative transposase